MIRPVATGLLACTSALALSVSACAESETSETEAIDAAAAAAAAAAEAEAAVQDAEPAVEEGPAPGADAIAAAPDSAWRTVDPENLLRITTTQGVVWVELADAFAPTHTARMRELARMDWYDFKVWHRVLDDFMAQGGGALDNPSVQPPTQPIAAEFTMRRSPDALAISELQDRPVNPRARMGMAKAGFWNGFPAMTQPAAAAGIMGDGRVESWLVHCDGAAAMARTADPNSANAQFYIVRGEAEHLNTQYTVWGKVRDGLDVVYALEEGTLGEDGGFRPDFIEDISVASDLPAGEQVTVQVMDTDSAAFAAYLDALRGEDGALPDLCEITVPSRVTE
ncbi:MAG: peptidylprolyl isomerase [Oceanicaulis sp.]